MENVELNELTYERGNSYIHINAEETIMRNLTIKNIGKYNMLDL